LLSVAVLILFFVICLYQTCVQHYFFKEQSSNMNLLSEEDDIECAFTINSDYAKRYDKWRKGEELQKRKLTALT